ncbi:MAG: YkgJ family cysteine cluster protein [Lachnospiraceae bacterium]|nr:YkgJ family cysteine cluster protein [Lachnospiraceae bacterium]
MKRQVDLSDISDGRLYDSNDMVKADCLGCKDCHKCCTGMGESIVLDPYDVFNLMKGTGRKFEELLGDAVEMNVVDGITLPNISMKSGNCSFLKDGRCVVHQFRPGICRMFPLGRYYIEDGFKYFLQVHECPVNNKGKIKVKKWIGYPDISGYEKYIRCWHDFMVSLQENLSELSEDNVRVLNILVVKTFYQTVYGEDFFGEFYDRIDKIKEMLGIQ